MGQGESRPQDRRRSRGSLTVHGGGARRTTRRNSKQEEPPQHLIKDLSALQDLQVVEDDTKKKRDNRGSTTSVFSVEMMDTKDATRDGGEWLTKTDYVRRKAIRKEAEAQLGLPADGLKERRKEINAFVEELLAEQSEVDC